MTARRKKRLRSSARKAGFRTIARTQAGSAHDKARTVFRLRWFFIGATAAFGSNLAFAGPPHAGLPNPCPGTVACAGHAFDPLATGSTLAYGGNQLQINQAGATAIFNWQSFNISAGNSVTFKQPSASSVALNRIYDPNVTSIAGKLSANGQIYLINPNGILFGSGAQVDVGGLIVSTLNVSNSRITAGLLSDTNLGDPAFTNNPAYVGSDLTASAGANPAITVQQGASLYAAGKNTSGAVVSAGRVFLFAPTVEVGGSVKVDGGGQAIVASGNDVYLGSSTDPTLRGLLVAVSPATAGGITIDPSGNISVARGNITLVGLAIKQAGTLSATSALEQNGSIDLLARAVDPTQAANVSQDTSVLDLQTKTGSVTLASGSQTLVRLDPTDTATAPLSDTTAAKFHSTINIQANDVSIGGNGAPGGTLLEAHGGNISVTARAAISSNSLEGYQVGDGQSLLGTQNSTATIVVGSDAKLDVSGLQNVAMDGALNYVSIDRLTSLNMADAPYQRTGFLLGQGVYVNLQNAPSWINVSNLQAAIANNQAQRNTVAGTIALQAEGSVTVKPGSVLDVSGGSLAVSAATGRTTQLITANGQVVNLDSGASSSVQYVGFADGGSTTTVNSYEGINVSASWQAPAFTNLGGYTQGQSAGSVEIYAPTAQLSGTFLGHVTTGPFQRSNPPAGGQLLIGSDGSSALDAQAGFSRGNIYLSDNAALTLASLAATQASQSIVVDTAAFARGGFTRYNLTSDGVIQLAHGDPLNLGPGGAFSARGNAVEIDSSITAPGGTVLLTERPITSTPSAASIIEESNYRDLLNLIGPTSPFQRGAVMLAGGVSMDVAGLWTNDKYPVVLAPPTAPIVLNGGSITLSGRNVDVSSATFDVSAGASLSTSGAFSGGKGGTLSITATTPVPGAPLTGATDTGILTLGAGFASRISGFGVTSGGTLVIGAPSIAVTDGPAGSGAVALNPGVDARGFSTYAFNAYDSLKVATGVNFAPNAWSIQNSAALVFAASQSSLLGVANPAPLLPGQAAPASITLLASSLLDGNVAIGQGATINAGVGSAGKITLTAGNSVLDDGSLLAPAGSVSLALLPAAYDQYITPQRLAGRSIQLGPSASIDVSGASLVVEASTGLRSGSVLDAGSVSFAAPVGIVAVDGGAKIAANGTADTVDVINNVGILPQAVVSVGGTVSVSADMGIYLGGSASAFGGGPGASGGSLSVALQAGRNVLANGSATNLAPLISPTNLTISSSLPPLTLGQADFAVTAPAGTVTPSLIGNSGFDHVWLQSADTISFAQSMTLNTRASVVLASQEISAAPGTIVSVRAPYVALGGVAQLNVATNGTSFNPLASATGGTAQLHVSGDLIDLVGNTSLVGIGDAALTSSGDVRGIGSAGALSSNNATGPRVSGSLRFGGNLDISAAQLYPVTQTDFAFVTTAAAADAANGNIQISSAPRLGSVLPPLSAGGSLAFTVNTFALSSASVVAPLGTINVNASTSITLNNGGVLSTAASALVPYGTVLNSGTDWTYGVPIGNSNTPIADYLIASLAGVIVPAKGITLKAPTVDAKAGSTINISGGTGDVLGTGFVAGPGGSYDMSLNFPYASSTSVALASTRNPYFALVPARGTGFAPYDPQIYADLVLNSGLASSSTASFQLGQTITIAAGSGIAPGTYTIMPPRYALLPGAFAVEAATGYFGISPGTAQGMPDGTVIVAGMLGNVSAGTSRSNWSGFRVFTDAQFRTLSQFSDYLGDPYFVAAATAAGQALPRTGLDAGSLQLAATDVLLQSTISATPASGGRGADISLTAPAIVVANSATASTQPQTELDLTATQLSALGAETLILGATESRPGGGTAINLSNIASSVSDTATTVLSAGEVILTGSAVTVGAGAQITATVKSKPQTGSIAIAGDGAALYVGNTAALPSLTRSCTPAPCLGTVGALTIENGASIGGRSLLFDASLRQTYAPSISVQSENVGLSAATVNFGSIPAGTAGLNLDSALLARFSASGSLTITSPEGFDVFGNAAIGSLDASGAPLLGSLVLVGPGIAASAPGAQLSIDAGHVTLDNSLGQTLANPGAGGGALTIHSAANASHDGSVAVAGNVALSGFQSASITAVGRTVSGASTVKGTGDVVFTGSAGESAALTLDAAGATLSIAATRITASRGVNASITVPGSLAISASGAAAAPEHTELGASLHVTAASIDDAGRIDLPSGVVTLTANGAAAADGVTMESGSSIRTAGVTQAFGPLNVDASAGAISIASAAGSVVQKANAVLDVSGTGTQGDAGSLNLSAPSGSVQVLGSLLLQAGSGARGADVIVDAGQLGSPSSLLGSIAAGTGGTAANAVSIRTRNGDLVVAAGQAIKAQSITLEADGTASPTDGSIQVAGTLDASGASGGSIALYANNQVTIATGALLDAHATAAGANGGQVLISSRVTGNAAAPTTPDAIVLQQGSTINLAAGDSAGTGGSVTLRANAAGGSAPTGVEIAALPVGTIVGQNQTAGIIVEGVVVQQNTGAVTIDAAALANDAAILQAYMANRTTIALGLGLANDPSLSLRPGLEIQSTGDMTLASAVDFATGLVDPVAGTGTFTWRYGGSTLATSDPGALTLRSAGNLFINANISDGFAPGQAGGRGATPGLNPTVWSSGKSWNYRLTAGADLNAANPNAVTNQAFDLMVGSAALGTSVAIRTGTGSINLNASRDIVLGNGQGQTPNVVYTAGMADVAVPVFPVLQNNINGVRGVMITPVLTQGGGNLVINAGRNVEGTDNSVSNPNPNLDGSAQSVNEWLYRGGLGTSAVPTVWWVNFSQFQQGFGALGGGNLTINAGGDLVRVDAMVPSNAYDAGGGLQQRNTGSLIVNAAGNIVQGMYFNQAGTFDLTASAIVPNALDTQPAFPLLANTRVAMGTNDLNIQVRESSTMPAPFNPTAYLPAQANVPSTSTYPVSAADYSTAFFTYGPNAALDLRAAAGTVTEIRSQDTGGTGLAVNTSAIIQFSSVMPPTVRITAFGGDVVGDTNPVYQAPSPTGQLQLLAGGGVSNWNITMSQADPNTLPQVAAPQLETGLTINATELLLGALGSSTPLHASDPSSAEIIARNGSISYGLFVIPKTTQIIAAGSIGDIEIDIQNSNAGSLSEVSAGTTLNLGGARITEGHINFAGLGAGEVISGGAMNLGTDGTGIQATANVLANPTLNNRNLTSAGASLIVAGGTGHAASGFAAEPDYTNLIQQFVQNDAFAASGSTSASLNAAVLAYVAGDAALQPLVSALTAALANRSSALATNSAFQKALANLPPATIAAGASKLASGIQIVANQQFVQSQNQDTFAPAYAAFDDLFPSLNNSAAAVRQFIVGNPFASATNGTALQAQALAGLPTALVSVIDLGLANPGTVNEAGSAFSKALAGLDSATLNSGARQLLANSLDIAGASTDSLRASGRLVGGGSPYAKGLTALAEAFSPTTLAGLNDINFDYNQITVNGSGTLAVFAPQGSVVVGQSSPPALDATASAKQAYQLGMFTLGGGDIIGMARDNYDVFGSRVFTIAGGDINLWSSTGNIDAGRGPRDVAVAPPPRLVVDANTGIASLDFSASVAGSGIGALVTIPDQPPSNINLMAPAGYVDAGEAGIRAQGGTVTLGTNLVLNAGNIQAAGGISGGAVVAAPPPPAPPSTSTSSGDKAAEDAQRNALFKEEAALRARESTMVVVGEFLQFGGDDCKDPDSGDPCN